MRWLPFKDAPKDGNGILAYGRHAEDEGRPGRYRKGDHWWAIIQWDIWREPHGWVFGLDGRPFDWGEPIAFAKLTVPGIDVHNGLAEGFNPLEWQ